MQELEGLLKNGRHVEFVEWYINKDREKNEAYKKRDYAKAKSIDIEKNKAFRWSHSYINNKEILSLSEQQLVDLCCIFGVLAKNEGLKTTQIRKILTRFNKIEEDKENFNKNDIIKLKPILAYTSARNEPARDLVRILDNSINKIKAGKEGYDDFKKICDFLRGVVAYHRLAGGSD